MPCMRHDAHVMACWRALQLHWQLLWQHDSIRTEALQLSRARASAAATYGRILRRKKKSDAKRPRLAVAVAVPVAVGHCQCHMHGIAAMRAPAPGSC